MNVLINYHSLNSILGWLINWHGWSSGSLSLTRFEQGSHYYFKACGPWLGLKCRPPFKLWASIGLQIQAPIGLVPPDQFEHLTQSFSQPPIAKIYIITYYIICYTIYFFTLYFMDIKFILAFTWVVILK